jgi:hypothetical protein
MRWHQRVVDRFEQQKTSPGGTHPMELHVIRLGDVAIATNNFDCTPIRRGDQSAQPGSADLYPAACRRELLPATARAVSGGGYGAVPQSNRVGPEGGQVLVDRTVELIESLWK